MRKLIAVLTVLVLGVSGVALAATAKTKKVSVGGTFHSALVGGNNVGAQIAGAGKDKSFGQIAILFVDVKVQKAAHIPFTFYTNEGSYSGTAVADLSSDASGKVTIANGKFTVTKGGGLLKGIKGSGTFSGTGTISTSQTITYKGTLTVKK
jgi:hypothetical protein